MVELGVPLKVSLSLSLSLSLSRLLSFFWASITLLERTEGCNSNQRRRSGAGRAAGEMASAVERSGSLFSHKSITTLLCLPGVLFVVSLDTSVSHKLLTMLSCLPACREVLTSSDPF